MKITGFRVTNYKSVLDSGWIDLEDLTVLVGKNESGKTSLLKALHKFKPFKPEPYVIDREWPRGRRQFRDTRAIVCSIRFVLNGEERAELASAVDPSHFDEPITVVKSYDGAIGVQLPPEKFPGVPPQKKLEELFVPISANQTAPGGIFEKLPACANAIRELAYEGRFDELMNADEQIIGALLPEGGKLAEQGQIDIAFITGYVAKVKQFAGALKGMPTVRKLVSDYVLARIPTFIFMDDYRAFRGTARLDQVYQRKQGNALTDEDRTLTTIMTLAGLSLDQEFAKGQNDTPDAKEQRQYDLNDAGLSLTSQIAARWKQRRYEVEFRADGHSFFTMVRDQSGPYLIPLEERSKGFQWFFSFDLMFMYESSGSFKGCVLLLDEPGLHLHPDAQRDLLARLEAYAAGNTLIYTTHLPFMIDLRKPERIRTISETAGGTVVDKDLNLSQPEARFTLQAALGTSAAQNHLIAQRNLVVEGVDDYWMITELSNLMARSGKRALPDDVMITAGGGASEAAYMASFMIGQKLQVAVLFDSDRAGNDAADKLIKSWLARYKSEATKVMKIGDVLGLGDDVAIEDVFDDAYYVSKVEQVYGKQLRAAGVDAIKLSGTGQIVKRVERFLAAYAIKFNKGSVAKVIRSELRQLPKLDAAPLSPEARARASKLINALAAIFE